MERAMCTVGVVRITGRRDDIMVRYTYPSSPHQKGSENMTGRGSTPPHRVKIATTQQEGGVCHEIATTQ